MRSQALAKLRGERLNPEAAAFFAVLAPVTQRRQIVRLIVAYQVLYDYLDGINEPPDCSRLRNGLRLHRALTDAVTPGRPVSDYYEHHPQSEDGGYLQALTLACRRIVASLPSVCRLAPVLVHAAERCGHAQSHNHATVLQGESSLVRWSTSHNPDGRYLWWEIAAGGISCLAIHALLALAADPRSTIDDAQRLDRAYFPPICAISALLDSLADYHRDAGSANHSFVAHYRDSVHAAQQLVAITADAAERIRHLRHEQRHAIILAGIVSFYVSSPSVRHGFPALAAQNLARYVGPVAVPMLGMMRVRRRGAS